MEAWSRSRKVLTKTDLMSLNKLMSALCGHKSDAMQGQLWSVPPRTSRVKVPQAPAPGLGRPAALWLLQNLSAQAFTDCYI